MTSKINEELSLKLDHAEALIMGYQEETEQLKMHILELQRKLISAESKKEVITEGYGESDLSRGDIVTQDFSQLQEKGKFLYNFFLLVLHSIYIIQYSFQYIPYFYTIHS